MPLLIGGATTSAKHTAVRIAPHYHHCVVHVLDASRSVGVVERLISDQNRGPFEAENRQLQQQLVDSYSRRQAVTLARVCRGPRKTIHLRLAIDRSTHARLLRHSGAGECPAGRNPPLIDWSPFFLTWELKGKYPKILSDPILGEAARKLFADAQQLLQRIIDEHLLTAPRRLRILARGQRRR